MTTVKLPFRRFPALKIIHCWLADRPRLRDASKLAIYYDCARTISHPGFVRLAKRSLVVDVSSGAASVLASCKSRTRTEIRRAQREGALSETEPDMYRFSRFYDDFADTKGLSRLDQPHLRSYWEHLTVTKVAAHDRIVAMHAWIVSEKARRATLLYSCSQFRSALTAAERNAEARVNRFLYWDDLKRFSEMGISKADFGCFGEVGALVNVNRFKSNFPVSEVPCSTYVSWPMWMLGRVTGHVPG